MVRPIQANSHLPIHTQFHEDRIRKVSNEVPRQAETENHGDGIDPAAEDRFHFGCVCTWEKNMKYKFEIGQEVILRPLEHEGIDPTTGVWCTSKMVKMAGQIMHISARNDDGTFVTYRMAEDPDRWHWIEDWLESPEPEVPEDPGNLTCLELL